MKKNLIIVGAVTAVVAVASAVVYQLRKGDQTYFEDDFFDDDLFEDDNLDDEDNLEDEDFCRSGGGCCD